MAELKKKKYGHNLVALFNEARHRGIATFVDLQAEDDALIEAATGWYDLPGGKRLQYLNVGDAVRGFKGLPDRVALESIAGRLLSPQLEEALLSA